jgi:hypothetical protein
VQGRRARKGRRMVASLGLYGGESMMAAGWVCGMAFVIFYISSGYLGRSLLYIPEGVTEGLLRFVHGRLVLRSSFKRKAQYISRRRRQLPPID